MIDWIILIASIALFAILGANDDERNRKKLESAFRLRRKLPKSK